MPVKSKSQLRFLFAAEDRGELPEGTARKWVSHTKKPLSKLPERLKKAVEAAPELLTTVGADIASGPTTGVAPTEFKPKAMPDVSFLSAGSKPGFGMQFTSTRPSTGKLLKPASGPITKLPNLEKAAAALPEVATPVVGVGACAPAAPAIYSATPMPTVAAKPSKPSMKTSPGLEKVAAGLIGGIMTPEQSPMSMEAPKATAVPAAPKLTASSTPTAPKADVATANPTALISADAAASAFAGAETKKPINPFLGESRLTPAQKELANRFPGLEDAEVTRPAALPSTAPSSTATTGVTAERKPDPGSSYGPRTLQEAQQAHAELQRKQEFDMTTPDPFREMNRGSGIYVPARSYGMDQWLDGSGPISDAAERSSAIADELKYTLLPFGLGAIGRASRGAKAVPAGVRAARAGAATPPVKVTPAAPPAAAGAGASSAVPSAAAIPAAAAPSLLRRSLANAADPLGGVVGAAYKLPGTWGKVLGGAADAATFLPRALTGGGSARGFLLPGTASTTRQVANVAGLGLGIEGLAETRGITTQKLYDDVTRGNVTGGVGNFAYQTAAQPYVRLYSGVKEPAKAVADAYTSSATTGEFLGKAYEGVKPHVQDMAEGIKINRNRPQAYDAQGNPTPRTGWLDQRGFQEAYVDRKNREAGDAPPELSSQYGAALNQAIANNDIASFDKLTSQLADVAKNNAKSITVAPIAQITPFDLPTPASPEVAQLEAEYYKNPQNPEIRDKLVAAKQQAFDARVDSPEDAQVAMGGGIAAVTRPTGPGPAARLRELTATKQNLETQIAEAAKTNQPADELKKQLDELVNGPIAETRRLVNDRALQYFEKEVMPKTRADADKLAADMVAFREKVTAGQLTSEDMAQLQSMRDRAGISMSRLMRFSLAKAQSDGVAPALPDSAATLGTFFKDIDAKTEAVDANKQPLTETFISPTTGDPVSVPIMIPATPLGKAVDEAAKAQIRAEAAKQGVSIPDSKIAAATGMMDPMTKMLLYGGAALTAVAAISGLMGGGSTLTTILGLLGIGGVAAGLLSDESVRSNPARLFEGGYWKQLFGLGGNAAAGEAGGETPSVGAAAALAGGLSVPGTAAIDMGPPAGAPASGPDAPAKPPATNAAGNGQTEAVGKYLGLTPQQQQELSTAIQNPKKEPSAGTQIAIIKSFASKLNDPKLPEVLKHIDVNLRKSLIPSLERARDNIDSWAARVADFRIRTLRDQGVTKAHLDAMINAVNASLAQ